MMKHSVVSPDSFGWATPFFLRIKRRPIAYGK